MAYNADQVFTQSTTGDFIEQLIAREAYDAQACRDGCGRTKVSLPTQELSVKFTHDLRPDIMAPVATGTGAVAHGGAGKSFAVASVTGASSTALLRSRSPMRYRNGLALSIYTSMLLVDSQEGIVRRVGYFNASDGVFLQESNGALSFVVRDSVNSVETEIIQANWNLDDFSGDDDDDNPSGLDIDRTKTIEMVVELQYPVGRIRFGFVRNGLLLWAHEQDYGNAGTTPCMASGNLNIAWEIESSAAYAGQDASIQAFAGAVILDADGPSPTTTFTENSGSIAGAAFAAATPTVAVAVRVADLHKFHSTALPTRVALQGTSAGTYGRWAVWRMSQADFAAGAGGAAVSWSAVGDESVCEVSTARTTVTKTSSTKVGAEGYFNATFLTAGYVDATVHEVCTLGTLTGDLQDVMLLVIEGINGTTPTAYASLSWREER